MNWASKKTIAGGCAIRILRELPIWAGVSAGSSVALVAPIWAIQGGSTRSHIRGCTCKFHFWRIVSLPNFMMTLIPWLLRTYWPWRKRYKRCKKRQSYTQQFSVLSSVNSSLLFLPLYSYFYSPSLFLFEKMMFKVFVASATTLSMALSVSAQLANCARNYTVQPGDVCDAISAANHVSTYVTTPFPPCLSTMFKENNLPWTDSSSLTLIRTLTLTALTSSSVKYVSGRHFPIIKDQTHIFPFFKPIIKPRSYASVSSDKTVPLQL